MPYTPSDLHVTLNHETELFRVVLGKRTLGRFEGVSRLTGRNGEWVILRGPGDVTAYVLVRKEGNINDNCGQDSHAGHPRN